MLVVGPGRLTVANLLRLLGYGLPTCSFNPRD